MTQALGDNSGSGDDYSKRIYASYEGNGKYSGRNEEFPMERCRICLIWILNSDHKFIKQVLDEEETNLSP